jgi:hypothetical protein
MATTNIVTRKKNLLDWIENLQDKNVLKKLEHIREEAILEKDNYMLPGEPMTIEELKTRVMTAHNAVLKGEFITHEDLKRKKAKQTL